jgi:hypothetical protein
VLLVLSATWSASESGQEALVYGVRKFRQLRKIFSTLDYWS